MTKILLADRDVLSWTHLRELLIRRGFELDAATDLAQALQ